MRRIAGASRGATLVEVAIATALGVMLSVGGLLALDTALGVTFETTARGGMVSGSSWALHRLEADIRGASMPTGTDDCRIALAADEPAGTSHAEGPILFVRTIEGYDLADAGRDLVRPLRGDPIRYRVADGALVRERDWNPRDGRFDGALEREVVARAIRSVTFRRTESAIRVEVRSEVPSRGDGVIEVTLATAIRPSNDE